jgi:hypothetical protein
MITCQYNLKESHSLIASLQLAFLFSVSATGFLPRLTSHFATVSIPMERYEFSVFCAVVSAPDAPTYSYPDQRALSERTTSLTGLTINNSHEPSAESMADATHSLVRTSPLGGGNAQRCDRWRDRRSCS